MACGNVTTCSPSMTACCASKTHREQTIELNDEQISLLERFSPEFRERQIEVHYTRELVAVDTFFVGALKGWARCICKPCWTATAATPGDGSTPAKLPVTSVHVLNETVLPFFEAHEARVYTIPVGQRARVLRTP